MSAETIVGWVLQGAPAGELGRPQTTSKPPLDEAYAVYIGFFAPLRGSSAIVGPLADFVEVLRQNGKDMAYSDEEWIVFFVPFVNGDYDAARDLWDGLLCQPAFVLGTI